MMNRLEEDDPLDPKRKIFNALAAPGGTAGADPLQQPGPVGGRVEMGPQFRAAPDVPVGAFSDGAGYVGALEERAKDPGLQQWGRETEAESRRAFDANGYGDQLGGTFGAPPIQTSVKTPADFAPGPGTPVGPLGGGVDYKKTGKYASTAYDAAKLARPWEEQSEKYRIGNVLSNFDPSQGLTPEVIAALNAADIFGAKFSGAGDKLTVDNAGGHERFGKGGTSDVNIGFKTGKGTWGAWTDPALEAAGAGGGAPSGGSGGGAIDPLLGGDPMEQIRAALAQFTGPRSNAQALLQGLL